MGWNISSTPTVATHTQSSNTSSSSSEEFDYFSSWHLLLRLDILTACVITGVCGNVLSAALLLASPIRKTTSGIYLTTLAVTNTLMLILETIVRRKWVLPVDWACATVWYFRYSISFMDTFITVAVCLSRTIIFACPFKAYKCEKMSSALLAVTVCGVSAFVLGSYAPITIRYANREVYKGCDPVTKLQEDVYFYADTIIGIGVCEILMLIIITSLTVMMVRSIIKQRKTSTTPGNERKKNVEAQITGMTTVLAIRFLLCKIPYSLLWTIEFVAYTLLSRPTHDDFQNNLMVAVSITAGVSYLNYCTNFFLYIIFWNAFRDRFILCFCCRNRRHHVATQKERSSNEQRF